MRVLHINYSDIGGGAEEFALSLVNSQSDSTLLVKRKHSSNSRVIEFPNNNRKYLFTFLDKVLWKLGIKISFRSYFGFQNKLHNTFNELSKLKEYKSADVIHLHNIHGEFFDLKAIESIAEEKPVIWTSHDAWINTGGEGGIPLGSNQRERRKLYPLKGGIVDERKKQLRIKKRLLAKAKIIVIVAPSKTHNSNIKKTHPLARIETIYNGIDSAVFNINGTTRNKNTIPKILLFYNSSPYKNSAEILAAYELINSEFELHVIGEVLNNNKISNIKNHGYITDRKELADLFKSMDMAAFSSKAETFGLLPAELAACGAKVFLNKTLLVFKEHAHIYGATLFERETHLANLIEQSLDDINQTRIDGSIAASKVEKHLNRKETVSRYLELYTEILNQWNKP